MQKRLIWGNENREACGGTPWERNQSGAQNGPHGSGTLGSGSHGRQRLRVMGGDPCQEINCWVETLILKKELLEGGGIEQLLVGENHRKL